MKYISLLAWAPSQYGQTLNFHCYILSIILSIFLSNFHLLKLVLNFKGKQFCWTLYFHCISTVPQVVWILAFTIRDLHCGSFSYWLVVHLPGFINLLYCKGAAAQGAESLLLPIPLFPPRAQQLQLQGMPCRAEDGGISEQFPPSRCFYTVPTPKLSPMVQKQVLKRERPRTDTTTPSLSWFSMQLLPIAGSLRPVR